jgi:hypothetical protein
MVVNKLALTWVSCKTLEPGAYSFCWAMGCFQDVFRWKIAWPVLSLFSHGVQSFSTYFIISRCYLQIPISNRCLFFSEEAMNESKICTKGQRENKMSQEWSHSVFCMLIFLSPLWVFRLLVCCDLSYTKSSFFAFDFFSPAYSIHIIFS